jgi:hypothetical protein
MSFELKTTLLSKNVFINRQDFFTLKIRKCFYLKCTCAKGFNSIASGIKEF